MNKKRHLKVLMADDDKPITNIYKIGLKRYFATEVSSETTVLEDGLFDDEDNDGPTASIAVCSQGTEAVELAEEASRSGEPFDVIVLDVRMPPGISGVDAAEKIRGFDQDVPIIFVSGYNDFSIPALQSRVPPPDRLYFVEKPIHLKKLADQIREVASNDA